MTAQIFELPYMEPYHQTSDSSKTSALLDSPSALQTAYVPHPAWPELHHGLSHPSYSFGSFYQRTAAAADLQTGPFDYPYSPAPAVHLVAADG